MNREYFRFVTLIFYTLLLVELIQGQCLNSSLSWTFVQRDVTQISGPTWTQSNTLRISGQGEGRDFGFGSNGDTFLLNYFTNTTRNGYLISRISNFNTFTDPSFAGPMVYVTPISNTGFHGAIYFPTPTQKNGFVVERDASGFVKVDFSDYNGGQNGKTYYGYSRIERIGTVVQMLYSDDAISWILLQQFTVGANTPLLWGFSLYTKSNTLTVEFDSIGFSGIGPGEICSSNTVCTNSAATCTADTSSSFVECGSNSWRFHFTSNNVETRPTFTIQPTTVLMSSDIAYPDISNDRYSFLFKRTNFTSFPITLTARVESWGTNPVDDTFAGVMIITPEYNGKIGIGTNSMIQCIMKYRGNDASKHRSNSGTSVWTPLFSVNRDLIPGPNWVRLNFESNAYTCSYSYDGIAWNIQSTPLAFNSATMMNKFVDLGVIQGRTPVTISKISLSTPRASWCNSRANECGIDQNRATKSNILMNLDQCNCNSNGFLGQYCEITSCFGIVQNGANVCSGNGLCIGPNQCSCFSGWTGDRCQYQSCFGVGSQNPFVCSGNGKCVHTDTCICIDGYLGNKCEITSCFGIQSNNTNVCSGRGSCSSTNSCACNEGYTGSSCSNCAKGYSRVGNDCIMNGLNCISPFECFVNGASCREIRNGFIAKNLPLSDGVYKVSVNGANYLVYCDMTTNGGGWTLNRNRNLRYSNNWTNNNVISDVNINAGEGKYQTYFDVPFNELLLVLDVEDGACCGGTNPKQNKLVIGHNATSLSAVIGDGNTFVPFQNPPTRSQWLAWAGPNARIQDNCNRQGFNNAKTRIGIIGNNEANCDSPDSALGFGLDGTNSYYTNKRPVIGSRCIWCPGENDIYFTGGEGYLFVRTIFDCSGVNWCSGNGACQNTNICSCYRGYTGATCSTCDSGFFNINGVCRPSSINCPNGICEITGKSCRELRNNYLGKGQLLSNGIYSLGTTENRYNVFCDMFTYGGGWTLALKQNGQTNVLNFDSKFWTNSDLLNQNDVSMTAGDSKYQAWNDVPFNQVFLFFNLNDGDTNPQGRHLVFGHSQSSSLFSIMSLDSYVPFQQPPTRAAWLNMTGPRGQLESNCNRQGFNVRADDSDNMRVRIGIINNDGNSCNSCNSGAGFGIRSPYASDSVSAGLRCADSCSRIIYGNGYIFIRENYDCSSLNHCSGNGICNSNSQCTCNTNYFGSTCNLFLCNSIPSNQTNVCRGRGTCLSPNTCKCNNGFTGNECQFGLSIQNSSIPMIVDTATVSFTFNSSVSNTTNGIYTCITQFSSFTATFINSRTVQCNSLTSSISAFLQIQIALNGSIINELPYPIYILDRDNIFPSMSIYQTGPSLSFNFSYVSGIDLSLRNFIFCRVDGISYQATLFSDFDLRCTFPFPKNVNFTLWMNTTQISLNSIQLFLRQNYSISYHSSSSQVGYVNQQNPVKITLSPFPSTTEFLKCNILGTAADGVSNSPNVDCSLSYPTSGLFNLSVDLNYPISQKIAGIHSTFNERFLLRLESPAVYYKGSLFQIQINTLSLIQANRLRSNCEDLILTYQRNPINRRVYNCSSTQTRIVFNIQKDFTTSISEYELYYNNPNITTSLQLNNIVSDVLMKRISPFFGSTSGSLFDDNNYSPVRRMDIRFSTQLHSIQCYYDNSQNGVQHPITSNGNLVSLILAEGEFIKNVTFCIGSGNQIGCLFIETNQRNNGPYGNLNSNLNPVLYSIDTRSGIMNCKGSIGFINGAPTLTGLQFDYRELEDQYQNTASQASTSYITTNVNSIQFDDDTNSKVFSIYICGANFIKGIGFTYQNGVKKVYGDRLCSGDVANNIQLQFDEIITSVLFRRDTTTSNLGTISFNTNYGTKGPYSTLASSTDSYNFNTGLGIINLRGSFITTPSIKIQGLQFDYLLREPQVFEQYYIRTTNRFARMFNDVGETFVIQSDNQPPSNIGIRQINIWSDVSNSVPRITGIQFTYSNGVVGIIHGSNTGTLVSSALAANEFIQSVRLSTNQDFLNSIQFVTNLRTIINGNTPTTIEFNVGFGIFNAKSWRNSQNILYFIQFDYFSYEPRYFTTSMLGERNSNENTISDDVFSPITRFTITAGGKVDSLNAFYQNGLISSYSNLNSFTNSFDLNDDERIMNISARTNTNGELGFLTFNTNQRVLGPYGTLNGTTLTSTLYQVDTSMGQIINVRKGFIGSTIYNLQFDISVEPRVTITQQSTINPFISNTVPYVFLERSNLISISPILTLTLIPLSVRITTNLFVNYGPNIQYEVRFGNTNVSATRTQNFIDANIPSISSGGNISLSLWARHTPTGQSYLISNNNITLQVYSRVNQMYILPFVGKYIQSQPTTYQVSLYLNQAVQTPENLFCKYFFNGAISFSSASLVSLTEVRCNITVTPTRKSELVQVILNLLYGSNGENIDLGNSNSTFVIFREEIDIDFQSLTFLNSSSFGRPFLIDMIDYRNITGVSYNNYTFTFNGIGLSCTTQGLIYCSIPTTIFNQTPILLDFKVTFLSNFTSNIVTFDMRKIYFVQALSVLEEYPFIENPQLYIASSLNIQLTVSTPTDSTFNYYTIINQTIIQLNRTSSTVFNLLLRSRGIEEVISFSIFANSSTFSSILSNSTIFEFAQLSLSSSVSNLETVEVYRIIKGSQNYILPQKYRSSTFRVVSSDSENFQFTCSVTNGVISCNKNSLTLIQNNDIADLFFKLQYETKDLTSLPNPLLVYKSRNIALDPPAKVIEPILNNLTITFDASTLKTSKSLTYFCGNGSNVWTALKINDLTLLCQIPSSFNTSTFISTFFIFNGTYYSLSRDSILFFYLTVGSISSPSNNTLYYFNSNQNITMNYASTVPSRIYSNIRGKVDTSYRTTTVLTSSQFNSVFTTNNHGRSQVELWYSFPGYERKLSTNNLIFYSVQLSVFTYVFPTLLSRDENNLIQVSTNLPSANYGDVNFYCRYENKSSLVGNNTQLVDLGGNVYGCNIFWGEQISKLVTLSIWASLNGVNLKITNEATLFLQTFFFTPSTGRFNEIQEIKMSKYTLGGNTNVSFTSLNITYPCSRNNTILTCTTIAVNESLSFKAYPLIFTIDLSPISSYYVIYDNRTLVDYNPKVVSELTTSFGLNILLNKNLTLREGLIYAAMGIGIAEKARFNFGFYPNSTRSISGVVNSAFTSGIYDLELFYYNEFSSEFLNQISFTPRYPLRVAGISTIRMNPFDNIFNINTNYVVTITLENDVKLSSSHLNSIRCKQGNTTVTTLKIDDSNYNCTITSSSIKLDTISLSYINSDAVNGEIRVSEFIDLIFISTVSLTNIFPHVTLNSRENITLSSSLPSDIYQNKVTYECESNNLFTPATINQTQFSCGINKVGTNEVNYKISIFIITPFSKKRLTTSIDFFFLNYIATKSIFPFTRQVFNHVNGNYVNQTISWNIYSSLALTSNQLFCRYNASTSGIILTPVTIVSGVFQCNISIQSFNTPLEQVQVALFFNLGQFSFVYSATDYFLFMRGLVLWNSPKVTNSLVITTNINVPTNNLFNYGVFILPFNGRMGQLQCNFISNINCSFINILGLFSSLPSDVDFNLTITHPVSRLSQNISVDSIIYYDLIDIQHLKPFAMVYSQRVFKPLRVVSNIYHASFPNINSISKGLNVIISQNGLSVNRSASLSLLNSEYETGLPTATHFSFSFNSFGVSNSFYNISISFENILISRNPAVIQVLDPIIIPSSQTVGPYTGRTAIETNIKLVYPTSNYQNYIVFMKVFDRDNYINFTKCDQFFSSNFLTCDTPNVQNLYQDWSSPRSFRIDITMNNMPALSLTPNFNFLKVFDVLRIFPSAYMITGFSYNLTFKTNPLQIQKISLSVALAQRVPLECTVNTIDTFSCPPLIIDRQPQFFLKINSKDEGILNAIIVPYAPIQFSNTNPSRVILSRTDQNVLNVFGNFVNSPDIIAKLGDQAFSILVQTQFIDQGTLQITIPPIYEYSLLFPIEWKLMISLDGGQYYFTSPTKFIYQAIEALTMNPTLIPSNFSSTFIIQNYPRIYVNSSFSLGFRLVDVSNFNKFVTINCLNGSCTSPAINQTGTYKLTLGLLSSGKWTDLIFNSNTLKTYTLPSLSGIVVTPSTLVRATTRDLRITGINLSQFEKAFIVLRPLATLFNTNPDIIIPATVSQTEVTGTITSSLLDSNRFSLLLSVNSVYNHPTPIIFNVLSDYNLTSLVNLDNARFPNYVFSFVNTNIQLKGINIFNTPSRFRLNNTVFTKDISRSFTFQNQSYFIQLPTITELAVPFQIQYPFKMTFGLSYNDYDYKYIDLFYVNTYPISTFTNAFPTIIGRSTTNITLFGLNMDLTAYCIALDANSNPVIETSVIQSKSVVCPLPTIQNLKKVALFIENKEKDKSSLSVDLFIYETPIITNVSQTVTPAYANFEMTINGFNFTQTPEINKIYCSVGSKECSKLCTFVNQNQIKCFIDSNAPGLSNLLISYNKQEYFNVTNILFTECEPGYTSFGTFTTPCTLCTPGTYKPTVGLYRCLSCENGTYSQFSGATFCEKCPANTTTVSTGNNSPKDCVCQPGFYMNKNEEEVNGLYQKCIFCPTGGVCKGINTTIPLAQEGYWYDSNDYTNFEICTPKISCPGGGFANCTEGYGGPRCGYCTRNYFRNRKICQKCDSVGDVWARLVGIAIVVMIITLIFFILASIKVSHISSLAIALSLWQVLAIFSRFDIQWPYQLDASLSVASVANLNTDFLSPNCIFPDLDYLGLWFLKMMIPIVFLLSFIILYIFLFLRSTFALTFLNIKYIKTDFESDSDSDEETEKKKKSKIAKFFKTISNLFISGLIWIRNFIVWFFTEKSSKRDFYKIYNKMFNAYMSFISFSFMFIITTSSEVFVCIQQSNGKRTMEYSPDLFCYEGKWWVMAPLSIIYYLIFGVGSFLYFVIIYFKFNEWSKDKGFNERNKFMLSRFKKGYYYWEAVVTVRKTVLSIFFIFFKPMFVIVSGVLILFLGLLLHIHFVPFKKKFHNLIEYFVLMITLLVLFFGLLFFVDKIQDQAFKQFLQWMAFLFIIFGTIVVVLLIITDIFIRKRKERAKKKEMMKEIREQEKKNERFQEILEDLHPGIKNPNEMPWDTNFDYKPITFITDSESPEDTGKGINNLFDSLFSQERAMKIYKGIQKKFQKVKKGTAKEIKKDEIQPLELNKFKSTYKKLQVENK